MKREPTAAEAAANLRAMGKPDWPALMIAVCGRFCPREEVVMRLVDLIGEAVPAPFSDEYLDMYAREHGEKFLALKVVEEASEAFGAWQRLEEEGGCDRDGAALVPILRDDVAYELADTVQACINLAHRLGLDLGLAIRRSRAVNEARGRFEGECDA